jgi:PhnB protein
MLSYGESAMAQQVVPDWRGKIIHAALAFESGQLTGVDLLPGDYKPPQGFFVIIGIPTRDRAEAVFHALSAGGAIRMPFQQTFWTAGFGVLVDRFGIPWEVNSEEGASAPPSTTKSDD